MTLYDTLVILNYDQKELYRLLPGIESFPCINKCFNELRKKRDYLNIWNISSKTSHLCSYLVISLSLYYTPVLQL
jgi:hypothetical protein